MNRNSRKLVIITSLLLPATLSADSLLSGNEVRFTGDNTAKRICQSIVNDDTTRLDRLLNNYRNTLVYRYHFTNNRSVAGDFACNERNLLNFAEHIGAQDISNYLRAGTVTMEELVSSVD